jgi:hypothetical protein
MSVNALWPTVAVPRVAVPTVAVPASFSSSVDADGVRIPGRAV